MASLVVRVLIFKSSFLLGSLQETGSTVTHAAARTGAKATKLTAETTGFTILSLHWIRCGALVSPALSGQLVSALVDLVKLVLARDETTQQARFGAFGELTGCI